jgi:hypothetical protein
MSVLRAGVCTREKLTEDWNLLGSPVDPLMSHVEALRVRSGIEGHLAEQMMKGHQSRSGADGPSKHPPVLVFGLTMNHPSVAHDHKVKGNEKECCDNEDLHDLGDGLDAHSHWVFWLEGFLADSLDDVGKHGEETPGQGHCLWRAPQSCCIALVIRCHCCRLVRSG